MSSILQGPLNFLCDKYVGDSIDDEENDEYESGLLPSLSKEQLKYAAALKFISLREYEEVVVMEKSSISFILPLYLAASWTGIQ